MREFDQQEFDLYELATDKAWETNTDYGQGFADGVVHCLDYLRGYAPHPYDLDDLEEDLWLNPADLGGK